MTTSPAEPLSSGTTRFLLLANLCRKLGELGCASCLLNPSEGGAVLHVDRPRSAPGRLSVAAVERPDGWAYAWNDRWTPVEHVDALAAHLTGTARP